MTISGKFNVFVEDKKGQEKSLFKTFSTTISTKQQDGSYLNKSIEVVLDKEEFPAERKAKFDKNYKHSYAHFFTIDFPHSGQNFPVAVAPQLHFQESPAGAACC